MQFIVVMQSEFSASLLKSSALHDRLEIILNILIALKKHYYNQCWQLFMLLTIFLEMWYCDICNFFSSVMCAFWIKVLISFKTNKQSFLPRTFKL